MLFPLLRMQLFPLRRMQFVDVISLAQDAVIVKFIQSSFLSKLNIVKFLDVFNLHLLCAKASTKIPICLNIYVVIVLGSTCE